MARAISIKLYFSALVALYTVNEVKQTMGNRNGRQPMRGENKKRVDMTLTPTCLEGLNYISETLGYPSRSETVEELVMARVAELQAKGNTAA